MTPPQARAVRDLLTAWYMDFMPPKVKVAEDMVVHHGCAKGADYELHMIATEEGWDLELHPASGVSSALEQIMDEAPDAVRKVHPATTPLLRNLEIAKQQALLAAPRWILGDEPTNPKGEGTWHAMRKAMENGTPMVVVYPDGNVVGEVPWSQKS